MVTTNPALDELGDYPLAPLQDLAEQLRADGDPVYDFSIGDPDEPTPGFIREALKDAVGPTSRYPTASGRRELREAVAGWLERRHGVTVDPDTNVLPTAGSKEGIFHLPLAVIDAASPKRHVIWGHPGYPVYERGTRFAGGESDPVALSHEGRWLLHLDELEDERLDQAAIAWVNYPHNPTGAVADRDHYARQLAVAREHDIHDETGGVTAPEASSSEAGGTEPT
ncbi:MAG: aminotransferase class I/II-fold pyridoxal phosphate-dependent enzyme [Actinobacteria bacterium]|nr:aminotransferase class I/II-fold pyridoxal phosphate-dependent enzyme [Actinomycetota bacterium]